MMLKKLGIFLIAALLSIALVGCTTTGGSKEATGTGVGAGVGALLGGVIANNSGNNPFVGAAIGAAIGGLIGNRIGAYLDEQERKALAAATQRAMTAKANQKIAWKAPPPKTSPKVASSSRSSSTSSSKSSSAKKTTAAAQPAKPAHGYVVPGEIYTKSDGQQCRNIEQVAYKDDKVLKDSTTACKTSSGWQAAAV
jgi:surface antigen